MTNRQRLIRNLIDFYRKEISYDMNLSSHLLDRRIKAMTILMGKLGLKTLKTR